MSYIQCMHNAKHGEGLRGFNSSLSRNHIKGMPAQRISHVMAWNHSACTTWKGKGFDSCKSTSRHVAAGHVMGLGCCGGVHSTSRPPQKDFSFPQLPLIDGLELCN